LGAATLGSHVEEVRRAPAGREDTMSPQNSVTRESIDRLCTLADLPLPAERRARLAPLLSSLVTAANDLSRKMAHAAYRTVVPIAQFPER
jgi:hypothetical protein